MKGNQAQKQGRDSSRINTLYMHMKAIFPFISYHFLEVQFFKYLGSADKDQAFMLIIQAFS